MIAAQRIMAAIAAFGMALWQEALLFGIISSLSLPIGAFLGQWLSPVDDTNVAAIVAFGAGALLFAVTVELYGHALHELAHGSLGYIEMCTTICCAMIGAYLYLWLNANMEEWIESSGEDEEEPASATSATAASSSGADPKAAPGPRSSGRWDRLRSHASDVGQERVKEKRKTMTAKEALSSFLKSTDPEHHAKMKAVRGRKKRMLLAVAGTHAHPNYGSVQASADDDEEAKKEKAEKGMRLAYAMFLGLLVDGIPESILLGFLAAENSLSLVLVLSLFVANFPEAFSSASLMKENNVSLMKIMGMWTFLMLMTGILAALACAGLLYFAGEAAAAGHMPFHIAMVIAVVEGIAGGAMIACIAAVMLPEAFGRKHESSLLMDPGFLCTAGFLVAVLIKVIGGVVTAESIKEGTEKVHHEHAHIATEAFSTSSLQGFEHTLSSFFMAATDKVIHVVFKG